MPTFTQEPYNPPTTAQKVAAKSTLFLYSLIAITSLYLLYYLLPSSITSVIPNPFAKKSVITVVGIGTVKTTPDLARFAVTIAETDANTNAALEKAKVKIANVTSQLKIRGLAESDISSTALNATPVQSGTSIIYAAGATIIVTSPNVALADELVNVALSQGARLAVPITLTVKDSSTFEAEAREQAIADAKEKAEVVASSFGRKIRRMVAYTETPQAETSSTTEGSANSQTGEISITHSIQVSFETK